MEEQQTPRRNFNWALFLGCGVVALAIIIAGQSIARQIPHTLHGSMHGSFSGTLMDGNNSSEFISEWEAATFLRLEHAEFIDLLEAGELSGTYTVFSVERMVWSAIGDFDLIEFVHPDGRRGSIQAGAPMPVQERQMEYEMVIVDHRVFSRERLTEWLHERIGSE